MSIGVRAGTFKLPRNAQGIQLQTRHFSQTCSRLNQRWNRTSGNKSDEEARKHVHIKGLPRSATPADVMRLARQSIKDDGLAKNIACARLDYNRFIPTGRAYITMTSGFYSTAASKALQRSQLSSLPLRAFVSHKDIIPRRRGQRGVKDAAERGVMDGNGYAGGIDAKGCDAVVYGLPGTIAAPALRLFLRRIGMVKLAPNGEPDCEVVKIEPPRRGYSAISKHLVRFNSSAEAHAFVRKIHMTFFLPEVWEQRYLIRARVVY